MKRWRSVLIFIGILIASGGVVRLFAGEKLFEMAGISTLWSDHPYFLYIYRTLGAFVIFAGVSVIIAATDIYRYLMMVRIWSVVFLFTGTVMLFSGFISSIPVVFFLPDIIFSYSVAVLLFFTAKDAGKQ